MQSCINNVRWVGPVRFAEWICILNELKLHQCCPTLDPRVHEFSASCYGLDTWPTHHATPGDSVLTRKLCTHAPRSPNKWLKHHCSCHGLSTIAISLPLAVRKSFLRRLPFEGSCDADDATCAISFQSQKLIKQICLRNRMKKWGEAEVNKRHFN